jgi:hypothetical protein
VTKAADPDDALDQLSDHSKHEELAHAVAQLSPEEAAFFLAKLEGAIKKRKIQIAGYLIGLAVWVIGMWFALAFYGVSRGFVGWVFLAPFAAFGAIIYVFGRWATKIGSAATRESATRE